jgi:hypothetical protein
MPKITPLQVLGFSILHLIVLTIALFFALEGQIACSATGIAHPTELDCTERTPTKVT